MNAPLYTASMPCRGLVAAILIVLLAASPAASTAEAASRPPIQLQGRALLDALRGGGYVLLFRHAATDYGQSDVDKQNLENCATQRNLSAQGRQQSVSIGHAFRHLQIPVAIVLASPYCRTLETARLAFGAAEPSPDLVSELSDDSSGGRERLTAALRGMLAQSPEPGTNTALVTHTLNIQSAVGLDSEEGEAIVASSDGAGSYTIIARVLAESWLQIDDSDGARRDLAGQGVVGQRTRPSAQALPTSARLAISAAR